LRPRPTWIEVRYDDGPWSPTGESLVWNIRSDLNGLEARTVNRFGVPDPISTVEAE
jgi:hypothetical protein